MLFFYHASACIPASLLNGKTRQATEVTCLEDPLISTRVESEHILITIIRRSVNNTRIAAGCEDILNDELGKTYLGRLEFFTSHVFFLLHKSIEIPCISHAYAVFYYIPIFWESQQKNDVCR